MRSTLVALLGAIALVFASGCTVDVVESDDGESVGVAEEGLEHGSVETDDGEGVEPADPGEEQEDPEPSPWYDRMMGRPNPGDPGDPYKEPEPAPWDGDVDSHRIRDN